ncbi:MAG TPA: sugar kinase [Terriglobales bacterium]|nr:sugar kinase [Terriglobales bacterium]
MPNFDITIAGEINLDLILYGLPVELPLEQELLASGLEVTLGSSSAITAHNLAALGSKVGFITRVGRDQLGEIAVDRLRAMHVDLDRITHSELSQTGLTVLLTHGGPRHILTYPGCMSEMSLAHLDIDYLKSARHFHLSSYFLHRALLPEMASLFKELKQAGLTISLDTNDDPADQWGDGIAGVLPYVDVLMPNEREACKLAGTEDFKKAVESLLKDIPLLVVKRGANGATAFTTEEEVSVKAIPVEVVDPVGAGDSFNAGFLHKWTQSKPLVECLAYGNLAAACSTTKPGGTEAFRNAPYWKAFFAAHAAR